MTNIIFMAQNKTALFNCFTTEQIGENPVLSYKELLDSSEKYKETEYLFSTWSMPAMSCDEIKRVLPKLKAVFYSAGTIKKWCDGFYKRGIKIFSACDANAVPVAEFTVAQILLANKGFFQMHRRYFEDGNKQCIEYLSQFSGNYNVKVGLIGCGRIARLIIKHLKPYKIDILVYDPYLSEDEAKELGVTKSTLDEIFTECETISNHLPNLDCIKGLITYSYFSKMKPFATFINTGRPTQIVTQDLIRCMKEEKGRTALLDVTDIEPLPKDNELWTLPNVLLTPHQAGSAHKEIYRMGEYMMNAYDDFINGKKSPYEITVDMLERMA